MSYSFSRVYNLQSQLIFELSNGYDPWEDEEQSSVEDEGRSYVSYEKCTLRARGATDIFLLAKRYTGLNQNK